jgi:hypothetical protein
MVAAHLESGALHRIEGAPEFARVAHVAYPEAEEYVEWFKTALQGLRHIAAAEQGG